MDFNYKSPITKIEQEIASQIVETEEGKLMYEVQKAIGYSIEKEELIKALQYDRGQYEKGYKDGYNANKWILCSERLPELSDRFRDNFYLVKLYGAFNDLIEVGYAHFVNRPERTWEIMSEHLEKYWRVISWQKLPESELYKED
jgi:hypothetical protein